MKKQIVLLLCLFVHALATVAQIRTVRHYTTSEGLANNAVYSITQDQKGRMWFGTIDGLHSYDGNFIRVWRDERIPSLGSNIYTIKEDDRLQLWIGSDHGLSLFDLKSERFHAFHKQTASGVKINTPVSRVMMDRNHAIWIATVGQGMFCYRPESDELFQYTALGKINSDYLADIIQDRSGVIWIASMNAGISTFIPSEDRFQEVTNEGVRNTITLFEDSQQNIWVGSSGSGLFYLDKQTKQLVQKLKSSDAKRVFQVRSIVEHLPGELLIASDEGLTKYDIATESAVLVSYDYNQPQGLNDNYLQTLFLDREQALWVGTYFGGVNYIPPTTTHFTHYNNWNSALDGRIISVFAQAEEDNLWIGTDDAGFFHWNRTTNQFTNYKPHPTISSLTYHNIHALLQDEDKLYIGMYMGGLDILDLKTGVFKNYQPNQLAHSLYSSGVYALYKDTYQQVWVGTTSGLNRYLPETDDFDRIYEVHPADISYLIEDRRGNLWVCSLNNGIYRLNQKNQHWRHYYVEAEEGDDSSVLPTNKIITASLDANENLWLGTDGSGLLKYDYEKDIFTKVGLPENIRVIHKIIAHSKELWLTTSNGLYCYEWESGKVRNYNKEDGLQANSFLPNSGIQLADGTVFIGGINGFNKFHPDHMISNVHSPVVILSDFQLFNKPVEVGVKESPLTASITYTQALELKHKHAIFSLSVATLSYLNPTKNQYRYKLEGFEKSWTETHFAPRVSYTNLPAGRYTFRVSSSNGDGVWNQDAISLPIRVLPPWWASWPLILLYFCLGICVMAALYIWMIKKQQQKLALLEIEKDKEIYQSKFEFFTQMIHEIRTPLTLILSPLESVMRFHGSVQEAMPQLNVIERNGKRLLNLVNQLMDFRKVESGGMHVSLADYDVKGLLCSICDRFSLSAQLKQITVVLNLPTEECYGKVDAEAFTKVVSNLLSNALKFTATHIWVDLINVHERRLELRIKDNGQGIALEEQEKIFTSFYQIKENKPSDNIGTGIGLLLVKKLVNLMQGELRLESELGVGSTFIISFERGEQNSLPINVVDLPTTLLPMVSKNDSNEKKIHSVLVVEDNEELADYLRTLLSSTYQVITASNGQVAFELLNECLPHLIISDVMMPIMDGMELCKRVKQDIRTSHIPLVLLTAKVEISDQVEGLSNGADLYLAKPFSSEVIMAQIASLLLNRERIKLTFREEPMTPLDTVAHSPLDKQFLDKMAQIVEDRMSEPDFSVDWLAQELAISRTGLFTKIKALIGITPNDFIRLIRFKKAAELLSSERDIQVNEVCFQVGFSSPSYFTKTFQAQFGMTPAEFKRTKAVDIGR